MGLEMRGRGRWLNRYFSRTTPFTCGTSGRGVADGLLAEDAGSGQDGWGRLPASLQAGEACRIARAQSAGGACMEATAEHDRPGCRHPSRQAPRTAYSVPSSPVHFSKMANGFFSGTRLPSSW